MIFLKVWFSYVFIICYCTSKDFLSKFNGSSTLIKNSEMRTEFVKNNMCLFSLWYARSSPIGASGFAMRDILYILFAYCSSCSKFALVVSIWLRWLSVWFNFWCWHWGRFRFPKQNYIVNFGGKLGLFTKVWNLGLFSREIFEKSW